MISVNEASLRHNCFETFLHFNDALLGGGGGVCLCKPVNHASSLISPPCTETLNQCLWFLPDLKVKKTYIDKTKLNPVARDDTLRGPKTLNIIYIFF